LRASAQPRRSRNRKDQTTDRAAQETTAQQTQQQSDYQAEQAAGIGQTDGEQHETEDRDADGRRPWELPPKTKPPVAAEPTSSDQSEPHSRDATGQCGNSLDLLG